MKVGQRVRGTLVLEQGDAIVVPRQAVFEHDGRMFVHRQDGSRFEEVEVELGSSSAGRVVIKKGLEEGDRIALRDPDGPDPAEAAAAKADAEQVITELPASDPLAQMISLGWLLEVLIELGEVEPEASAPIDWSLRVRAEFPPETAPPVGAAISAVTLARASCRRAPMMTEATVGRRSSQLIATCGTLLSVSAATASSASITR